MELVPKMADLMLTSLHIYLPVLLMLCTLATCKSDLIPVRWMIGVPSMFCNSRAISAPQPNITAMFLHAFPHRSTSLTDVDFVASRAWDLINNPIASVGDRAVFRTDQLAADAVGLEYNSDAMLLQAPAEKMRDTINKRNYYSGFKLREVDEQNINGWLGQDNVRLPCNFHQDVIVAQLLHQDVISALYWSKMRDPTKAEEEDSTKASYFKKQLNSLEDRFTLNEDFSLSISDLQVADEGRYLCQVEFESDKSLLMYQTLTVYELRKSIRDYTFKIPDSDDKATAKIGLYGEMGAGKSTFINSIEFAYKGQRSQPTRRRRYAGGGHSMIRSCLPLTDYISLFDNRGMSDFSHSYVDKYMKEIRGDEKEAGTQTRLLDEEIQCVVFVYRHSGDNTKQDAKRFLDKFATELRLYFGYSAFVVVTHADSLSKEAKADLKETFSPICDKLWFLENYTDDIEDKEKSIRFLKFLKAALHRCDVAIVNIERRKTQRKKKWFWQRWLGW
nr:uncharacterized protein LOC129265391 [Lytechinus pictus]